MEQPNIGAIVLTVTNNTGGGQPVSMSNAREAAEICRKYMFYTSSTVVVLLKTPILSAIVKGICIRVLSRNSTNRCLTFADGCIMSAKKDALVNIGGFLALKDEAIATACTNLLIITEGFTTYGGLAGRDMKLAGGRGL